MITTFQQQELEKRDYWVKSNHFCILELNKMLTTGNLQKNYRKVGLLFIQFLPFFKKITFCNQLFWMISKTLQFKNFRFIVLKGQYWMRCRNCWINFMNNFYMITVHPKLTHFHHKQLFWLLNIQNLSMVQKKKWNIVKRVSFGWT